jgi:hypothetical protein
VFAPLRRQKELQAAAKNRFTVSPHCPRETPSLAPSSGQVRDTYFWGPGEKDNSLPWVRCPNLLGEFERFRREVSASVEHDEIVDIESPQKSCGGNLFSFMHLDCVTSQDGGAHLASCLAAVDQKNFFARESRTATQWRWAIHRTPRNGPF